MENTDADNGNAGERRCVHCLAPRFVLFPNSCRVGGVGGNVGCRDQSHAMSGRLDQCSMRGYRPRARIFGLDLRGGGCGTFCDSWFPGR